MAPQRPLPPLIQQPLSWIAAAFRIRSGWSPGQLERDITPIVDTLQGGLGLGEWITGASSGGVGNPLAFTLPGDKTKLRLVQFDINGAAAGGQSIQALTQLAGLANTLMNLIYVIAPAVAGGLYSWSELARGQQWMIVPPGYDLLVNVSAVAGINTTIHHRRLEVPAGTKPW